MSLIDRDNILNQIHEGMGVVDMNGNSVGTVEYVKFGNEDLSEPGNQSNTPDRDMGMGNSLVHNLAEALVPGDDMPETLQNRLDRYGYIKVDPGMLQRDHYVTPDMIDHVTTDKVFLKGGLNETPTR